MKREMRCILSLMLCLCLCIGTALADTFYVKSDIESPLNLRDENTNEVLITIPADTALEPDGFRSTDLCAYVSYGGYSGLVLWNYLTRVEPGDASEDAQAAAAQTPALPAGSYTLRTIGAVIQEAETNNKGKGPKLTEMTVTAEDNVIITAQVPKGKKLVYWVINGVRYDFLRTVKWMRMTAFDRSWTVEAVYKNIKSETLRPLEEILASRTGETCDVKVINGELCHLKSDTKGGGGWIPSFDFTSDYSNRATGAKEQGGQLSAKIRAKIPGGKRVAGWKFFETKIYPVAEVNDFIVRTLDTSMIYEPIFGMKNVRQPDPEPEPSKPRREPDPTYYDGYGTWKQD